MKFRETIGVNSGRIIYGFLIFVVAFTLSVGVLAWQSMTESGNESDALQFISAIHIKQNKYASVHSGKFASTFAELGESGEKFDGEKAVYSGYAFSLKVNQPTEAKLPFYSISADPQIYYYFFPAGTRHFYFDSTLRTIKCTEENRPANADDFSI